MKGVEVPRCSRSFPYPLPQPLSSMMHGLCQMVARIRESVRLMSRLLLVLVLVLLPPPPLPPRQADWCLCEMIDCCVY